MNEKSIVDIRQSIDTTSHPHVSNETNAYIFEKSLSGKKLLGTKNFS